MLKLSEQNVELNATCHTKDEAMRLIAKKMTDANLIEPEYLAGMLEREQQTSTFLGSGIAIPHGTPETRDLVKQTGIQVVRFPQGLDWGEGQKIYTAIGIAAKSDDHLIILRQLTHVISNAELADRLHNTLSVEEVIKILSGEIELLEMQIEPGNVRSNLTLGSIHEAQALAAAILCPPENCPPENTNADTVRNLLSQTVLKLNDNVWLACAQDYSLPPAVAVVQFRTQVQNSVLLIALMTRGENHRALLDHLLDMQQKNTLQKLLEIDDPLRLCELLKGIDLSGTSATCRLPLPHGLHARPATHLVRLVKSLGIDVYVENLDTPGEAVKANSVARLISIGVCFGQQMRFTVPDGSQADKQLDILIKEVAKGLGDDIAPLPDTSAATTSPAVEQPALKPTSKTAHTAPLTPGDTIHGLCGAPGMAIGPVFVEQQQVFEYEEHADDTPTQIARLEQAITDVKKSIHDRIRSGADNKGANREIVQITEMHLALLDDPALIDDANTLIRQNRSAEWAWHTTYERLAERQESNSDLLLAERAADFRDVGQQVLSVLTGQQIEANETTPHILVCHELAASKVPLFDPGIVQAVITVVGGVTSHAAILARSAGIPLLVGCGKQILTLTNGTILIVDCDRQQALLPKSEMEVRQAQQAIEQKAEQELAAFSLRMEPAMTSDGVHIEVVANVANSSQIANALAQGAEGIGLYRSEFVYMEYGQEPTVEQQTVEYQHALEQLGERPFVVRTLDVGGDKPLPYIPMDTEENPFLGVRGVRLSLLYPEIFQRQVQALLSAAARKDGNLKIMFPMICDIDEWRQLKEITMEEARNFPGVQFELGMMIEVPSAALLADAFAPELDFFSIGTNDLTQYTMAIDRGHPTLSGMADPLHPSVLKLIKMTVDAASRSGGWVGVCGELGADPVGSLILTGLGVTELSMSVKAIAMTKARIRTISMAQAQAMAAVALAAESAQAVRSLNVEDF